MASCRAYARLYISARISPGRPRSSTGRWLPTVPVTGLFALRTVTGFSLLAWRAAEPAKARADVIELGRLLAARDLTVAVHARLPLAEVVRAHRLLDDRAAHGRITLVP